MTGRDPATVTERLGRIEQEIAENSRDLRALMGALEKLLALLGVMVDEATRPQPGGPRSEAQAARKGTHLHLVLTPGARTGPQEEK